jgi:hypothetical protein
MGETVYHLQDFTEINGSVPFKTASTANATDLIRPIQYGQEREDIISILTIKRNKNFEISVDIIFDDEMERDLMQTDIIFKGKRDEERAVTVRAIEYYVDDDEFNESSYIELLSEVIKYESISSVSEILII